MLSKDLGPEGARGVMVCGEKIFLMRAFGRVNAVQDRCLHRGVRFSARPECFAEGRITCWLHGFTYDVADGKLVDIIAAPGAGLIGKDNLKTYPVQERNGLIFVFVGDMDPPPPLDDDTPPTYLDEDMATEGIARVVNSNWRVACENGNDATHIWIHRESPLIVGGDIALPAGFFIINYEDGVEVIEDTGRKGVISPHGRESHLPCFEPKVEGTPILDIAGKYGTKRVATTVELWMPCGLRVTDFPQPGMTHFEFYTPIDETRHLYVQMLGRKVANEQEAKRFRMEVQALWEPLDLRGFNDEDIFAREHLQEFYQDDDAWLNEQLFQGDVVTLRWRTVCSRWNRGIQWRGPRRLDAHADVARLSTVSQE
jgi:carbazole 1,9a-dioxygenase terminal dioxygenase component